MLLSIVKGRDDMKILDKEHVQELGRYYEGRSFLKAKYFKCGKCGEVQSADDVKCPECGSYDLTEVYLSAQEMEEQ